MTPREPSPSFPDLGPQTSPLIDLLSSLHRLLKVARMYDKNNQALQGSAEAVVAATAAFCASQASPSADVMFASETVFVNGRMLQMPRDVYARVMELGALLERCDVANVNVARTATVADLVAFVDALGNALRDPERKGDVLAPRFGGVRARRLRWRAALEGASEESPVARGVRTYASAVVVLRRYYTEVARAALGTPPPLPLSLRRLAQRIVGHAEREPSLLVALTATRDSGADPATLAVKTAIVAVLMARPLTSDGEALTDLALAGLTDDLGHRRLRALADAERDTEASLHESPLSEEEKDRTAASSAVMALATGELHELAVARTVIAFEAHWQGRGARLGALYGGKRGASTLARILSVARAFGQLMAPAAYAAQMGAAEAIAFLESRTTDEAERLYLRLLTGGLGIVPAGASVELDTREIGVVVRVPEHPVDFARPVVRIVYDAQGNVLPVPLDVDLAAPVPPGQPRRALSRALEMDAHQTHAMRAFLDDAKQKPRPAAKASSPSWRAPEPPRSTAPLPSSTLPQSAPRSSVPLPSSQAPHSSAPRTPISGEAPRVRPTISPAPLVPRRPTVSPASIRPEAARVRSTISPGALRPQDVVPAERPSSVSDLALRPSPPEAPRIPLAAAVPRDVLPPDPPSEAGPASLPRTRYVSSPTGKRPSQTSMGAVVAPAMPPPAQPDDTLKTMSPAFESDAAEGPPIEVTRVPARARPNVLLNYAEGHESTRRVDWRSYGELVAEATPGEAVTTSVPAITDLDTPPPMPATPLPEKP